MGDDYTLLTPENVELRYDVASFGSRSVAALIDYFIIFLGYLVIWAGTAFAAAVVMLSRDVGLTLGNPDVQRLIGYVVIAFATLLVFLGWWGYFVLFELLWGGQTPGKRLMGLRVVRAGGQPVGIVASLIRNLLRPVDVWLPAGAVVMLFERSSRRLGDLAAGTLVVREPRALARSAFAVVSIPEVAPAEVERLANAARLSMAHYTLLRDYFARRPRLAPTQADALAARLAAELSQLLEVPPAAVGDPVTFLAAAARAFEMRHRYYDPVV